MSPTPGEVPAQGWAQGHGRDSEARGGPQSGPWGRGSGQIPAQTPWGCVNPEASGSAPWILHFLGCRRKEPAPPRSCWEGGGHCHYRAKIPPTAVVRGSYTEARCASREPSGAQPR